MQFINKKHFPSIKNILLMYIGHNSSIKINFVNNSINHKLAIVFLLNTDQKVEIKAKLITKHSHLSYLQIYINSVLTKTIKFVFFENNLSKEQNKDLALAFFILPITHKFNATLNINAYLFKNLNIYLTNDIILPINDIFLSKNVELFSNQQYRFTKAVMKLLKTEAKAHYSVLSDQLNNKKFDYFGIVNVKYNVLQFSGSVVAIPQFRVLPASIQAEHSLLIYRLNRRQQTYLRTKNIDVKYLYDRLTNATSNL